MSFRSTIFTIIYITVNLASADSSYFSADGNAPMMSAIATATGRMPSAEKIFLERRLVDDFSDIVAEALVKFNP